MMACGSQTSGSPGTRCHHLQLRRREPADQRFAAKKRATFVYDHNGERVKATVNGETTIYAGPYYEKSGDASTKYYYADGRRVALRRTGFPSDNGLFYLLPDHLGSTTVVANPAGTPHSETLYKAWGETRYETTPTVLTDFRFTGQREVAELGLYYYGARYYDPYLNRWIQPDTIVPNPGDPQALNRYSYVLNNPVRYTDPTGMFSEDEIMQYLGVGTWDDVLAMFGEGGAMAGAWGYLEALRQAQLGTPISMWLNAGNGLQFNIHQPNMIGSFYETNGELMFSGAFIDWSGAGGSWTVGAIGVVSASQLIGAAAVYQAGPLGNYLDPNQQYLHLQFDMTRVDSSSLALGVWSATADVGFAIALGGAASGQPGLALAGALYWMGGTTAGWVDLGRTVAAYQRGDASSLDVAFDVGTAAFGSVPILGLPSDAASIVYELQKGYYMGP